MSATGLFPSRTVSWYMARMFLVRTFAILAALVLILQALDLLQEVPKIQAHPENGSGAILHYLTLRIPQMISRFLPFSVLLATLLTFTQLNTNSEIVALRASGLSAHQVLAPLLLASLGVAVVSFAFNDRIVARATATLDRWQKVEYAPVPIDKGDRSNVWVRAGDDLILADGVHGRGNAARLTGVTVFDRNGDTLATVIRGAEGMREGNGWRIAPAQRFDVASGKLARYPALHVGDGVRPDQFTMATVDADGLSFLGLRDAIHDLQDAGRPVTSLEGALWHKISSPLSAVLMPLLGAVAAFGLARSGKLFIRAVIGMGLGFTYFVADNFALSAGNLGAYPPFLAAWAPFLLFALIGETVLIRTEE
jgi:lipopolysaccharide export system permease protein